MTPAMIPERNEGELEALKITQGMNCYINRRDDCIY